MRYGHYTDKVAKTINKPWSCLVVFGHVSSSQPIQTAPPLPCTKSPSVCPAPVPTGPGQSSGRRSAYNGCVFRAELFEQWEWRDLQVARWLFVQSWAVLNMLNMFNLLNHPIWGSFEPYQNFSIWQMCRPSSLAPNELRLWLSISLPKCICPAKSIYCCWAETYCKATTSNLFSQMETSWLVTACHCYLCCGANRTFLIACAWLMAWSCVCSWKSFGGSIQWYWNDICVQHKLVLKTRSYIGRMPHKLFEKVWAYQRSGTW